MNAYEYFTQYEYKKKFFTNLRFFLNPIAHINERLLNNSGEDIHQTEIINNQTILSVVPTHLRESLQNRTINIQNNSAMAVSSHLTSSHSLCVLRRDMLERRR
jgi:hypothetical protein